MSAGLLISPCGTYVVGGGNSGTLYVWRSLGGCLLQSIKAHYRAITVATWSECGRHLVTGGADGIVHTFSIVDLVDASRSKRSSTQPIRTWSNHHLPVTALVSVVGGRTASASTDGQVILMEVFSESVLATLQLPVGIQSLTSHDSRICAGGVDGAIYLIDLDEYAMYQTAQAGATVQGQRNRAQQNNADRVLGTMPPSPGDDAYITELKGHDRTITAMATLEDKGQLWLCSGDETGIVRIWDLDSRSCVRVIHTSSHSAVPHTANHSAIPVRADQHPVTSIQVLTERDPTILSTIFSATNNSSATSGTLTIGNREKGVSIVNLLTPLQKFAEEPRQVPVPFLSAARNSTSRAFWNLGSFSFESNGFVSVGLKKQRVAQMMEASTGTGNNGNSSSSSPMQDERQKLQAQLDEAQATIARWEAVNQKLLTKLQSKS
jgi:WD40 repeat protein